MGLATVGARTTRQTVDFPDQVDYNGHLLERRHFVHRVRLACRQRWHCPDWRLRRRGGLAGPRLAEYGSGFHAGTGRRLRKISGEPCDCPASTPLHSLAGSYNGLFGLPVLADSAPSSSGLPSGTLASRLPALLDSVHAHIADVHFSPLARCANRAGLRNGRRFRGGRSCSISWCGCWSTRWRFG